MRVHTNILDTSGAITELITTAEAALFLRVDGTYENSVLSALISAAREQVEAATRMSVVRRTFKYTMDCWAMEPEEWWDGVRETSISSLYRTRRWVELPKPPLVSVQSVTTYNDSDVGVVMPATDYLVDTGGNFSRGRLVLRTGAIWPVVLRAANGVEIAFTAGYTTGTLPFQMRQAMLTIMDWMHKNRGGSVADDIIRASGAFNMLSNFINWRI